MTSRASGTSPSSARITRARRRWSKRCSRTAGRSRAGVPSATEPPPPTASPKRSATSNPSASASRTRPAAPVDLTLVDTPGFVDFFEETKLALVAADAAVIVIDAEPGRVAQTAALVEYLETRKMPHLFFVNKLDRPGRRFRRHAGGAARRVRPARRRDAPADRHRRDARRLRRPRHATTRTSTATRGVTEIAVPGGMRDAVEAQRTILLEALADFDDTLMEELLDGKDPEPRRDRARPVRGLRARPDRAGAGRQRRKRTSASRRWSTRSRASSPRPRPNRARDVDGRPVVPRADGPVVAQVCKTIVHPQQGKLSVVRVFTGTLTPPTQLVDASRGGAPVRLSGIVRLFGKKPRAGHRRRVPARSSGSRGSKASHRRHAQLAERRRADADGAACRTAVRGRHRARAAARRSEALAGARAADRRRPGAARRARRAYQRAAAARQRRDARRRPRPNASRASTTST